MKSIKFFIAVLFLCINLSAQKNYEFDNLINNKKKEAVQNLTEILKIPNVASNVDDILKNINLLKEKFSALGFKTSLLETKRNPQFYIEKIYDKNFPTVLFYLQLDGQPVDSSKWEQPDPFTPVFKKKINEKWKTLENEEEIISNDEARVFARSASDSKGAIAMFLTALQILNEQKTNPSINIKAIFDTEEEIGSPYLTDVIEKNKDLLKADFMVVLDGPMHTSGKPTLLFGARGIITIDLKVYGTYFPQHSGHYGNYAPNPALLLSKLLGSMKDYEGRVLIEGFYDGINLSEEKKRILKEVPDDEKFINEKLGIFEPDKVGENYQESIQYPSLNINGIRSAWVGEQSRTIVPSEAEARLDIRTVPESDPDKLIELLKKHIIKEGFHIINGEPQKDDRSKYNKFINFDYNYSYPSFRTDINSAAGKWLRKIILSAHKTEPVIIQQTGGSIPIAHFINGLNINAVILPTVNHDNNQHSPNENLRMGNYFDGIKTLLYLFTSTFQK